MRISDWSSDVCSSDLRRRWARGGERGAVAVIRVMMGAVVASAHSFAAAAAPAALVVLALLGTSQAQARERILSYDTVIEVHADGSLDIVEDIRVRAEGRAIRRGIYRDFPTRYRDRIGNRVVVGFEVVGVQRDGKPEPWFTENVDNGVRINTGNDDFLQVPAEYTYTLHYTTDRQVGFFDDHDELYFNAIGIGWNFAIERGSVEVRLPQPVPVADLTAEAYTGGYGSASQDFHASVPAPGTARWTLTRPLAPGEGMTVALSFPKGVVAEPTPAEKARWLLKDNSAVLIALCGLAILLVFCFLRWRQVGRDPHPGVVVVHYDPPEGYSPADLRYVKRMQYDNRCFSSNLLLNAVEGLLRIRRDKQLLSDSWHLTSLGTPRGEAKEGRREVLAKLFADGPELDLDNSNATPLGGAPLLHANLPKKRSPPPIVTRNDNRCFSSNLLLNAVEGLLRIRRDKQLLSDSWHLTSLGTPRGEAKEGRREVLAKLFADGPELDLDNSNATTIGGARLLHAKLLKKRFTPRMFKRNGGSIGIGFVIALLSMAAAIGIGVVLLGSGAVLLIPVGIAMLVALSVFGSLVKAPTAEGRKLLDQIEGFRRYLGVAERDELAGMEGPDAPPALDATRYERLLPYAVALDVEDAWTSKFTLAVGAAAVAVAAKGITWYQGAGTTDLGSLGSAIGNSLTSQIASSSTPPGSSSGDRKSTRLNSSH